MAEMKSRNEELCTSADVISSENEVLNAKIKELDSIIEVLQSEKNFRCSAARDENEGLLEKMMKIEEEKRNLMNEKESFEA